jgi:hypothetical protein
MNIKIWSWESQWVLQVKLTKMLRILFTILLAAIIIPSWAQIPAMKTVRIGTPEPNSLRICHLQGTVSDSITGDVLPEVNLKVGGTNMGAISDKNGRYELQLQAGEYVLTCHYMGYLTGAILLQIFEDGRHNFRLKKQSVALDEITIIWQGQLARIKNTTSGLEKIKIEDIALFPTFLGEIDVIKSLYTLPGVQSAGEGSGSLHVRGGRADQNLLLQDGVILYQANHALGFFSVFNPEMVEDFSLYKGHIPASFGGKGAAVLDVKLKDGDLDTYKLNGGIGPLSASLMLNIPVVRSKSAIQLGMRGMYSDWILNSIKIPAIRNSSLTFHDLNIRYTHKFSPGSKLRISVFDANDNFLFDNNFGFKWGTSYLSTDYLYSSKSWSFTTLFSYSKFQSDQYQPGVSEGFHLMNGMNTLHLKEEIEYLAFSKLHIGFGGEYIQYSPDPEKLIPFDQSSSIMPVEVGRSRGREMAVYLNSTTDFTERLALNIGFRFNVFQSLGPENVYLYDDERGRFNKEVVDSVQYADHTVVRSYSGIEPRVSLRYSYSPLGSVKISYNRINQYIHLISNTASPTPVDQWILSNYHIGPQVFDNYSVGLYQGFRENIWEIILEVFYKKIHNYPEYVDFADLLVNDHIETELVSATSKASGVEFSIKKLSGKVTGRLSYTYARSLVRSEFIQNNAWYPTNYDQPHQINFSAQSRLGSNAVLSATFSYNTGKPFTPIVGNYSSGKTLIPIYSARNGYRIPDYHRLDIGLTFKSVFKRWHDSLSFSVYNVYARKNAYSIFYDKTGVRLYLAPFQLSIIGAAIPSVSYHVMLQKERK